MTPNLLRKWNEGESEKANAINQLLILLSIYSVMACLMGIGLRFFGDLLFNVMLGKKGDFQNVIPIMYYLLMGLPFIVAYAFLYRLYLLSNTSTKFMIYSIIFLSVKFALFSILFNILNYQMLAILSGGILVIVYVIFIFYMNELKPFRFIMLKNFFKVFAVTVMLGIHMILFSSKEKSILMVLSGIMLCASAILLFRKTIALQLRKIKSFKS
jgi:O-antigen/teichoic acid export membrane protein